MYLTDERREYNETRFPSPLPASEFSKSELLAAEKWRNAYLKYMRSIEDEGMPDAECEAAKSAYDRGIEILEAQDLSRTYKTEDGKRREDYKKRKRVLHAVNALCVYGEPDELGHQEYTLAAAKVGLAALASKNF
jgi:hypothetical protein